MVQRAVFPGGVLKDEVDEVRPAGDRAGQYASGSISSGVSASSGTTARTEQR